MENLEQEQEVACALMKLGISPNLKGYKCLRVGILLILQDETYLEEITKRFYVDVARACGTTPIRTERAIRHAISKTAVKKTNGQFIAELSEKIRLGIEVI